MELYVGLDVSLKQTSICVVDGSGEIVSEGTVNSEPAAIAEFIESKAGSARSPVNASPRPSRAAARTRGRSGRLGLTPQWTFTSYPLPACPGALRCWLRVLKKSEPTDFVQLSFLWADFEATLIQHRPGL